MISRLPTTILNSLRFGSEEHGSVLRSDVGDEIAEPVDLQHHPAQPVFVDGFWFWGIKANVVFNLFPKLLRVDLFGQPRRHGRKNIARVKRIADRLQKVMLGSDVPHVHALFARVHQRKHAIVGRDEMIFVARGQNRPPLRAHAGIDHHHMYRAGGKVGIRLRNGERSIQHVEGLHGVADIDNLRLRHEYPG